MDATVLQPAVEALRALKPTAPDEYCFLWINWWATCLTKAEWAAWVQAIFSVVAILAAVGISQDQARRARAAEIESGRVAGLGLYLAMNSMHGRLKRLHQAWQQQVETANRLATPRDDANYLRLHSFPADDQIQLVSKVHPAAAVLATCARSDMLHLFFMMESYVVAIERGPLKVGESTSVVFQLLNVVDLIEQCLDALKGPPTFATAPV